MKVHEQNRLFLLLLPPRLQGTTAKLSVWSSRVLSRNRVLTAPPRAYRRCSLMSLHQTRCFQVTESLFSLNPSKASHASFIFKNSTLNKVQLSTVPEQAVASLPLRVYAAPSH